MDASSIIYLTKFHYSIETAWTSPSLTPAFAYCNMLSFQSTGGRVQASQRKTVLGRALQKDEFSVYKSSVAQTVNRDRLIALFRRIQESISEGENQTGTDTSSQLSTDDSSVETSVIEFLHQSTSEKATQKGRKPKKEKSMSDTQHTSNNTATRPPSNFVKKSPIPSPTLNRSKLADGEASSSEHRDNSDKFGELKANELKVLAKERGIKGYSKLKKSELIELLRFHV